VPSTTATSKTTSSSSTGDSTPTSSVTSGVTIIQAVDIATWRSGGWRTDTPKAFQGSYGGRTNHGYWFYGNQFAQLSGKTVTKCEIWMHAGTAGAYGPTTARLRTHTCLTRPSTEPSTAYEVADGPAQADGAKGWWTAPTSWGTNLVAGTRAGIAVVSDTSGDYASWCGLAASGSDPRDAMSGAIRLTWTT